MLTECWGETLDLRETPNDWIWTGFLRRGQITLLTGMPKAGKTTLLSHVLAHRDRGVPLLDQPLGTGVSVIITEETARHWVPRCRKLDFGRNVCFFFRPFALRPTQAEFATLIAQLIDIKERRGVDLVVFDTLSRLLPLRCENSPEAMQEALEPISRLAQHDIAILLSHHPAKRRHAPGQAARGTSALPGSADILLELHPFATGAPGDRRRLLYAFSRNEETPPSLSIELNAEGTAYVVLPDEPLSDFPEYWPMLRTVLQDASEPLTRAQIRERWAEAGPRPSIRTLWNWLSAACAQSLVARGGAGNIAQPYEYWLPSKMPGWLADPLWCAVHGAPHT